MSNKIYNNELFAEKLDILHFCVNCNKLLQQIDKNDERAVIIGERCTDESFWVHKDTQKRYCCGSSLDYAFPRTYVKKWEK